MARVNTALSIQEMNKIFIDRNSEGTILGDLSRMSDEAFQEIKPVLENYSHLMQIDMERKTFTCSAANTDAFYQWFVEIMHIYEGLVGDNFFERAVHEFWGLKW